MASAPAGNNPFPSSTSRRPSFTPTTPLSEMFPSVRPPAPYPGPITAAAAQVQQRRRMSISGTTARPRRESVSSISSSVSGTSSTPDDSAIIDEEATTPPGYFSTRRMSLGGRAMRDVRMPPVKTPVTSPVVTRGFWLDSPGVKGNEVPAPQHHRSPSLSSMPTPTNEMPTAREPPRHDPLAERILKGDFYMD